MSDGLVDNAIRSVPEALWGEVNALFQSWDYTMRSENKAATTRKGYLLAAAKLVIHLGKHPFKAKRKDIQMYLAELFGQGYASASVRHEYAGCQQFYRWAVDEQEIAPEANPFLGMKPPRVETPLKDIVELGELVKVLDDLDKRKQYRDAAMISLLADSGLRSQELCNILVAEVDMDEAVVTLPTTKNHEVRHVPFSSATGMRIDRWMRHRKDTEALHLFTGQRSHVGKQLTTSGVLQIVKRVFAGHGMPQVGTHDLRHTFATLYLDDPDARTEDLQAICGWNSSQMVERYTKQRKQRRAVAGHARSSPLAQVARQ